MPSESKSPPGEFKRLHPWAIPFRLWTYVKYMLPGGAFIFFTIDAIDWQFWLKIFVIPAVVGSIFAHFRYRYSLAETDLIILTGIFGRNERHIAIG